MAEIRPFPGIRYRLDRAEAAGAVICPPYDVISPAQRQALAARDPHNVVRLELPQDEGGVDRYQAAARLSREWLDSGVLARDPEPCLYVYGQRYETPEGSQERLGVMAALRVEPYEAGVVLPHEQTFPKHKEDRFRLLSTARAQFSPIFALYSAPEAGVRPRLDAIAATPPASVATDAEGVEHRFWVVCDPEFTSWAVDVFSERQVFIADGHHRYETALRYAQERRAAAPDAPAGSPFEFVMTFLVEMDDPGLVLLPTHRLLRTLPEGGIPWDRVDAHFDRESVVPEAAGELAHHQIGVVLPGGEAWRLTLRDPRALERFDREHSPAWRDLDVAVLHRLLFQEVLGLPEGTDVAYTRDGREAVEAPQSGGYAAAFLLPFPRVEELKQVAGAGDKMPQKSTYFWPKAVTGLVIYGQ